MSNYYLNDDVDEFIKEIIKKDNFKTYDVEDSLATKNGDGYMGVIKLLEIKGKTENNVEKVLNFILKLCHSGEAFRAQVNIRLLYGREIFAYEKVFPTFLKLQYDRKVKTPLVFAAKCYATSMEPRTECLVLENLKDSGFKLWEKNSLLDIPHAVLVLKAYARYHALSLAVKSEAPELWKELTPNLKEYYLPVLKKTNFVGTIKSQIEKVERNFIENNKIVITKVLDIFKQNLDEIFFGSMFGGQEKYFVAIHGDCWVNNMLFKYEDKALPENPTDLRLLDFQVCRNASPALDLSYFIYCCSPKECLDNLDYYLHIYHDTQREFLEELGCKSDLYPFAALKEDWKKCGLFGVALSFGMVQGILVDRENLPSMAELAETNNDKNVSESFMNSLQAGSEYYRRMEDVLKHSVHHKLI